MTDENQRLPVRVASRVAGAEHGVVAMEVPAAHRPLATGGARVAHAVARTLVLAIRGYQVAL